MNFHEYQILSYDFAEYNDSMYPVLGLAEEVGELMTFFAKMKRGDYDRMSHDEVRDRAMLAKKEIGDILWMLSAICTEQNWSIQEIARENIKKLTDRQERDIIKGTGDER